MFRVFALMSVRNNCVSFFVVVMLSSGFGIKYLDTNAGLRIIQKVFPLLLSSGRNCRELV